MTASRTITPQEVLDVARNRSKAKAVPIVGIDGGGGSGKSTLATLLQRAAPELVTVVHLDDFYRPSGEIKESTVQEVWDNWDRGRLISHLLRPLQRGQVGRYQRYDWGTDALSDWHNVSPNKVVIVEGCYALMSTLTPYYALAVWVETPRNVRLARGIERDGEEMRGQWEEVWMPAEDAFVAAEHPDRNADYVVDGSHEESLRDGVVRLIERCR